ncbi:hypothetical protein PSK35_24670 [Escherichia coli]|nr:hypothetical protein [Escherichia coli]
MSQIAKLLSQVIKAFDAEDSKVRQDLLDGKFTNTLWHLPVTKSTS